MGPTQKWGPCVVRGPVDDRFLVWWVIDNVVWTDSWLSIAGAGCDLTSVGAGEEQARNVVTCEASRCGEDKYSWFEGPGGQRSKGGPHSGKNSGTKSWTISWLSLKTKVEPGLRGSRVMSGDWRRLHWVRGVCSGSPENHWVTRLSQKTEAEDSTRRCDHPGRSNHPGGAVRPPGRSNRPGGRSDRPGRCRREASKRRIRVEIARLASRLSKLRSLGIRPMAKIWRLPNSPLRGLYP
jgi:hypothetical protein